MKVTGIIAEYNPFHNGHLYQLQKAKEDTKSNYTIVIMSGNHVERGVPSIVSKYERTKHALMAGADLVLELPLYYSTGSVDYFSKGAVSLLNNLNIVNSLHFGSESGNIDELKYVAYFLGKQQKLNNLSIKSSIKEGNNYAASLLHTGASEEISGILSKPNNLLGIHYLIALAESNSNIIPFTTKRICSDYNDSSEGALSSTSIRESIQKGRSLKSIESRIPQNILITMEEYFRKYEPINENDYSLMLFYKIQQTLNPYFSRTKSTNLTDVFTSNVLAAELTQYVDVSDSLANKISKKYKDALDFTYLTNCLKSKDLTHLRINRALLHILLDITKKNMEEYASDNYNYYARVLGFKKSATPLLHKIKEKSSIPLITKMADSGNVLEEFYLNDDYRKRGLIESLSMYKNAIRMLDEEVNASELYEKTVSKKSRQSFVSEYEKQLVIL